MPDDNNTKRYNSLFYVICSQGMALLLLLMGSIISSAATASSLADNYATTVESVVVIKVQSSETITTKNNVLQHTSKQNLGSGVIFSEDGKILTATHVVKMADQLKVTLHNGRSYPAEVVATIDYADLALIKITSPPKGLKVAKLGQSSNARVGEQVYVIGSPYGIEFTLTQGILSSIRTQAMELANVDVTMLQTDAAINKGNSGGPVFNENGEVIGIVSSIMSKSGGNEGLGFAVSVDSAKQLILEQPAFWAGVSYVPVRQRLARALNLRHNYGLLIQNVAKNSLGYKLGLQGGTLPVTMLNHQFLLGGDVIIKINDVAIEVSNYGIRRLFEELAEAREDKKLTLQIMRAGKLITLTSDVSTWQ